jgi:hypothetical protein
MELPLKTLLSSGTDMKISTCLLDREKLLFEEDYCPLREFAGSEHANGKARNRQRRDKRRAWKSLKMKPF